MGCGCQAKADDRGRERSCAVMCAVCPERGGPICTVKELPIRQIIELRLDCPLGHHPDKLGVLCWLGLRWYGVPAIVRWLYPILRRLHGWPKLTGPLPWCGCLKRLKDLWSASRGNAADRQ